MKRRTKAKKTVKRTKAKKMECKPKPEKKFMRVCSSCGVVIGKPISACPVCGTTSAIFTEI